MQLVIVYWPIAQFRPYERNPRKNDAAVARMVASIREYGFTVPMLARSTGEVIDGHLRLKAALQLELAELPVILCDGWTEAQVKAFRLLVNRSVNWADWDKGLLGDTFRDDALQSFLESSFALALDALNLNAAWYLWHAHLTQGFFAAAAAAAAHVILHRQIIWVKPVLLLGRGQYHWKHEPCFMGWVEGNQPPDYGERNQTTVWEVGSVTWAERREFNHSTPKPVELFRRPIMKHLQPGEIAYDPFAGSGPQFIAAELTGRRCFGLEIAPEYCDVIVARWEKLTGQKATLETQKCFPEKTVTKPLKTRKAKNAIKTPGNYVAPEVLA